MVTKNIQSNEFQTALLEIDRIRAAEIFESIYNENESFEKLEQITMEVLDRIGTGWEEGQVSLSQVYMSGIICEELIDKFMIKNKLPNRNSPKIAIAVLQDHHALGKRIVNSILKADGLNFIDFGHGLSVEEIVEKTIEEDIEILLISTLMLNSALKVKHVVKNLHLKGSKAKIIVGGAPFRLDENLWERVNADATGKNGTEVVKIIEKFVLGGLQ